MFVYLLCLGTNSIVGERHCVIGRPAGLPSVFRPSPLSVRPFSVNMIRAARYLFT